MTRVQLRLLDPQQTPKAAEAVAQRGAFFKVGKQQLPPGTHELVVACLFDGIRHIAGEEVYARAQAEGLSRLHTYFPIDRVRELKDFAAPRLQKHLFELTARVGRDFLGLNGEFYVDTNAILRINYPFAVAKNAPKTTDDPSVGSSIKPSLSLLQKVLHHPRVSGARTRWMTWLKRDTLAEMGKTWAKNSSYDPAAYHNHLPPAAWAHGPHIDTWYGHAFDGINLWWAIDGVTVENSMVLYPDSFGKDVQPDPKSMYLRPGTPLPAPASLDLGPGDMLLFNPEILHATHINIADSTRIAVTTRINPSVPHFDPRAPFSRTQWLQASDIENGHSDRLKVFPRELHLRIAEKPAPDVRELPTFHVEGKLSDEFVRVCASAELPRGNLARVSVGSTHVLVMRGADGLHAVAARCPHLGLDMADGHYTEQAIFCPGHGLVFDFASGQSQCSEFRLRVYDVEERDGAVYLRRKPSREQASADGTAQIPSGPTA